MDSDEVVKHLKKEQEKVRIECEKKRRPMEEVLAEYQSLQDETSTSAAKRQKLEKDTRHTLSESSRECTSTSEAETLDTSGTSHSSLNSSAGVVDSKEIEHPLTETQEMNPDGASGSCARTHGLQSM